MTAPADDVAPSPAIVALQLALEAEGIVVGDADGSNLVVWVEIEGQPEEAAEPAGPDMQTVIGIFFTAPEVGDPDRRWQVTVETPVITALGDLGSGLDLLSSDEETGWGLSAEDGQATLAIRSLVALEPWEGPLWVEELAQLFVDFAAELAPSGLRFACLPEEQAGLTTPGYREMRDGEVAFRHHRFIEAQADFADAARIFITAKLSLNTIAAEIMGAICIAFSGRAAEGQQIIERCLDELPPPGDCDEEETILRVNALGLCGLTSMLLGHYDDADRWFAASSELGTMDGVEWMRNMARAYSPDAVSELPENLLDEAHLLAIADDPTAQAETAMLLSMYATRTGSLAEANRWLTHADTLLVAAGDGEMRPAVLADLCRVRSVIGDRDGAQDALDQLRAMPEPLTVPPSLHRRMVAIAEATVGRLFGDRFAPVPPSDPGTFADAVIGKAMDAMTDLLGLSDGDGPDEQLATMLRMREFAQSLDDDTAEAVALTGLAEFRLRSAIEHRRPDFLEQARLSLDDCLEAIRLHDGVRHRLLGISDRGRYTAEILQTYELALLMACDLARDPALAAELLSRIKAVGLPDQRDPVRGALLAVEAPLHFSVDERCQLAPPGAQVVSLESDWIDRQAGPSAWWWSMWQGRNFLFWALVAPSGAISAGAVALDPQDLAASTTKALGPVAAVINHVHFRQEALGPLLERVRAALPISGRSAKPGDAVGIDGLLGCDPGSEPELMAAIGRLLIPEQLAAALRSADRAHPIRILCDPSPSLAWFPLNLLAVPDGRLRQPARLVERAVLQHGAPYGAVVADRTGEPTTGGLLAVIDPQNDHGDLWPLADRADFLLAGSQLADQLGERADGPATSDRVLSTLAGGGRYRVFLYAGHARSATADDPLGAGLALGLGDARRPLTVRDIVEQASRLQCPPLVVLCACSTQTGPAEAGTERWDLATAFMHCGARSVVVTGWDLLSCPSTTRFVDQLVLALAGPDPADALRQVQLSFLDRWQVEVASGSHAFDPASTGNAHPFLWAPFMVVGRL